MKPSAWLTVLLLGVAVGLAHGQGYQGAGEGIAKTAHDRNAFVSGAQAHVCHLCHSPHSLEEAPKPQWASKGAPVYGLYAALTLPDDGSRQPGPVSKVCLSCHDGTVAVTDYAGAMGRFKYEQGVALEKSTVVSIGHPFGVAYDADLARRDPSMFDPEIHSVTIGSKKSNSGAVSSVMLISGRLECTSCHDVHNRYTAGISSKGLTKVSMMGSRLCLECHAK